VLLKSKKEGFSLVELAVVLAIISILIALIVPKITKQADRTKEKRAKAEIALMKSVIDSYFVEHGTYPKDSNTTADTDSIQVLLFKNGIDWGSLDDPWGNGYIYDADETYKKYVVYSTGSSNEEKDNIVATNEQDTKIDQAEPEAMGGEEAVISKKAIDDE
jgi:general secretion pathway protein G